MGKLQPLTQPAAKTDLVLYEGVTTSNGLTTTVIDSSLIGSNDFLTNATLYINSGAADKEIRDISSFTSASGTITVSTAFSTQILSGISYKVLAIIPADIEVVALQADVTIIKADTQVIEDSTLKAAPTAGSLARFIASGGTALGSQLPDSKSLYDCLSGGVAAANTVVGRRQVFAKAITVAANAGATTIGTITTQPCIIESIIIHANTAQTANLTSCAVTGGASNIITFINAAIAIQANLDAIDKQVSWTGSVRLGATKTIVITPVGIAATALDLTIIITYYSSAVSGGYIV